MILGFTIILIGIAIIIIGSLLSSGKGETRFAVGGFIGPIPFGFGNDKNMVYFSIILAFVMIIVMILMLRFSFVLR
ncbi:MAG: DUF131 domain-containing protein [Candidatus Aenigmarchaeota archaeon]|nr:DUF131 domain-containing protein [Candidatus Aenigmarchaeota archaeon]